MSSTPIPVHNSAIVEAFDKVKEVAQKIEQSAQSVLVKIFGQTAVDQFETTIKSLMQADVIQIFTDAVTVAESLQVGGVAATGAQKQSAAFAQITSDLEKAGKTLGTNVINLGIEMFVGLLHAKTPAAPAS